METLQEIKRTETSTSRLSVELVYVTPKMAENYLMFNDRNRKVSEKNLTFLIKEMKEGRFIENGESIVFDKNGNLKDGQHRLQAISKSGRSYFIPIVRGVNPISMATYDTGKNRSAGDVLTLNGFKWGNNLSALIIGILKYSAKKSKSATYTSFNRTEILTNQQILEYCEDNYDWLKDIVAKTHNISQTSKPTLLSTTQLGIIAYLIGGERPQKEVYEFLNHIVGNSRTPKTATNYLYTKLYNSKVNKEPFNFYWLLGASIKCFNYFIDGNPSIRSIIFTIDQPLPQVNKLNN